METVVITGANRGIGLQLTQQYLAQGKRVIATSRNLSKATQLKALTEEGELSLFNLEITDKLSVNNFKTALANTRIDILINNAGIMGSDQQSCENMDYDAWLDTFNVNTLAPFRLCTALKTNLLNADNPRIVTLSSLMASLKGEGTGSFAYRTSKAAVNKAMQLLALEYKSLGITVCPVHPGWVKTDMGGEEADICVEESVSGLIKLINHLTLEQTGRFWQYDGRELDW